MKLQADNNFQCKIDYGLQPKDSTRWKLKVKLIKYVKVMKNFIIIKVKKRPLCIS